METVSLRFEALYNVSRWKRFHELCLITLFAAICITIFLLSSETAAIAQTSIERVEIPTYDNTTHQLNGSKITDAYPYRLLAEMSDSVKRLDEIKIPNGYVYNRPTQKYVPMFTTIYATEYVACVKQLHDTGSITFETHTPVTEREWGEPWQITIQNATLKDCVYHNSANWDG